MPDCETYVLGILCNLCVGKLIHRNSLEYTMQLIRLILGKLILLLNWLITPSSVRRDPDLQASIDQQTARLKLYQYQACPFCVKVRRAMKRHTLSIETLDVNRNETARLELLAGGGALKVPCLRIEDEQSQVEWLYDSADIIRYLESRFVTTQPVAATV
jgi:glutaredoxin